MTLLPPLPGRIEDPGVVGHVVQVVAAEDHEELALGVIGDRRQRPRGGLGVEDFSALLESHHALKNRTHPWRCDRCGTRAELILDCQEGLAAELLKSIQPGLPVGVQRALDAGRLEEFLAPRENLRQVGRPDRLAPAGDSRPLLTSGQALEIDAAVAGQQPPEPGAGVAHLVVTFLQRVGPAELLEDRLPLAVDLDLGVNGAVVGLLVAAAEPQSPAVRRFALAAPDDGL